MANTTYNITDIWKQVSNLGSTDFVNVTDGTKRTVPWGHLEWIGFVTSIIFTTTFIGGLGFVIGKGFKIF